MSKKGKMYHVKNGSYLTHCFNVPKVVVRKEGGVARKE
jgi:hypothetical protein